MTTHIETRFSESAPPPDRWMRGRRELIAAAVRNLKLPPENRLVLDVAASDGHLSAFVSSLTGGRLITSDLHGPACMESAACGREAVRGDALRLPFSDGVADVTIAFEIIEHFGQPGAELLLEELHRVTKPAGILLLSTPNRYSLEAWKGLASYLLHGYIYNARDETHVRILGPGALRAMLRPHFRVQRFLGYSLLPELNHRPLPGTFHVTENRLLARLAHKLFVVAERRDRG